MRLSAFLFGLLIPAAAAAQHYQTDFPAEEFKARHAKVFEQIGANAVAVVQGLAQTEGFTLPGQHNTFYYLSGTDTGFENFTDFLPMGARRHGALVLEQGVVQKVPATPASAITKRR